MWPDLISTNLVHLIPKPAGGMRPIGLMATLVRLYERVRRPAIQAWRRTCSDSCNYMTEGRSAADAVWVQSVRDEAAKELGLVSASVLLDLIKAFECVRLDIVWQVAIKLKFPMVVMKLVLRAYCHARRLVFCGVVGEPIASTNAILAGGGFATDMLALLLVDTIAVLRQEVPRVHLFVVVDDLTIRVEGTSAAVAQQLTRLTALCVHQLEEVLHMKVSRGKKWTTPSQVKSVAMASSREARQLLLTGMRALGILVLEHARNLGVDYAPGKRSHRRGVLLSRWAKVKAKVKRCRKIGSKAAGVVARTALLPAAAYGTSCTGIPKSVLNNMRSAMAGMHGPMNGRSTTARLAVHQEDPTYPVVLSPLWAWWRAAWESTLPTEILAAALRRAEKSIETAGHLAHSAVEGGAGAYLSSLKRIKWSCKGLNTVLRADGTPFTLGSDGDPKMALRLARRDLEMIANVQSGLASNLSSIEIPDGYHRASSSGNSFVPIGLILGQLEVAQKRWWEEFVHMEGQLVPWLKPALDELKGARRRGVSEAVSTSFASLIEGGWWPQARLYFSKLAEDPLCQACGAEHGTLWHRFLCSHKRREVSSERKIFQLGAARWWDPLFNRGVPALPLSTPQPQAQTWIYPENGGEHLVTGDVYTDGALRGLHPEARRAGWAFALVDSATCCLKMAVFGSCEEQWLTVLRAELHAIEAAIRRAVPPLVIHTDSAVAVDGYTKGKKFCCSAKADGADIWRRIWFLLSDFGEFQLHKVKAHTTASDVAEGLIPARHQAGNSAADHFAVQARKAAQAASPTAHFEVHYARARAWYKTVLNAIVDWKDDAVAAPVQLASEQQQYPAARHAAAKRRRHEIWSLERGWVCRTCGKTFRLSSNPKQLVKAECGGSMQARLFRSMGVPVPPDGWDCFAVHDLAREGGTRWTEAGIDLQVPGGDEPPPAAAVRRRLVGKQPDPRALDTGSQASQWTAKEKESGHLLLKAGRFSFCDRCGRWAIDRLGPGLLRKCVGNVDTASGAYRVRRERLRAGRHPLSNRPLE